MSSKILDGVTINGLPVRVRMNIVMAGQADSFPALYLAGKDGLDSAVEYLFVATNQDSRRYVRSTKKRMTRKEWRCGYRARRAKPDGYKPRRGESLRGLENCVNSLI